MTPLETSQLDFQPTHHAVLPLREARRPPSPAAKVMRSFTTTLGAPTAIDQLGNGQAPAVRSIPPSTVAHDKGAVAVPSCVECFNRM